MFRPAVQNSPSACAPPVYRPAPPPTRVVGPVAPRSLIRPSAITPPGQRSAQLSGAPPVYRPLALATRIPAPGAQATPPFQHASPASARLPQPVSTPWVYRPAATRSAATSAEPASQRRVPLAPPPPGPMRQSPPRLVQRQPAPPPPGWRPSAASNPSSAPSPPVGDNAESCSGRLGSSAKRQCRPRSRAPIDEIRPRWRRALVP
jgi:hypothetical protein